MLDLVKNNYKVILSIGLIILLLPVFPVIIEIIFKFGNIVGTWIRHLSTNGICF